MFNVYIFYSIYTWITIITVIWIKSANLPSITCALNSSFWHCRSTFEIVIAGIPTMLFWWASVEGFNDSDNFTIFAGDVSPSFVFTKYVAMDYWCRNYNTSFLILIEHQRFQILLMKVKKSHVLLVTYYLSVSTMLLWHHAQDNNSVLKIHLNF